MSNTSKVPAELDAAQTLQLSFNEVDYSLTVNGFLVGKVGRKVTQTISTTSSPSDTLTFTFTESGTSLYAIKVIYTDNTYNTFVSAERIS